MMARAGYQNTLSSPGATCFRRSDWRAAKRDSVLVERIATAWTPMTKIAPTTAATTCATKRVRRGPIVRKSPTVKAIASAEAAIPIAMTTP